MDIQEMEELVHLHLEVMELEVLEQVEEVMGLVEVELDCLEHLQVAPEHQTQEEVVDLVVLMEQLGQMVQMEVLEETMEQVVEEVKMVVSLLEEMVLKVL